MAATILLFYTWISMAQAARILGIFPLPFNSHFTCNNAVLNTLAEAGHEITVITTFPDKAMGNNYASIIDISHGEVLYVNQVKPENIVKISTSEWMNFFKKVELNFCEKIQNLEEMQEILKSEYTFDVIFVEIVYYQQCYYWIGKKFNIPVIGIVTYRSWIVGDLEISNPRNPVLVPVEFGRTANHKHFYDRLDNTWKYFETISKYYWETTIKGNLVPFYQTHVRNYITYKEFMEIKPTLIFVNSHFSYFPRSTNPNVIEIGGITLAENKSLPEDIQSFLDGAEQGAILFTFGSVIRAAQVPKHKIQAFADAFAEIPQRIIWKYEEEIEGISSNVMLVNWLPQPDILAHKHVIAFISHCGQGAIHESIYHGVPLISCPIGNDQQVNANIFENLQIAVHLDYKTITKKGVLKALNEVINNTRYYEKMQKLSQAFKDRPMTPQEMVVYWTEYIIRHKGAPHLMSPANNLNWFQYLLLDVICFVNFIFVLVLLIIYFSCNFFYSFIKYYCINTSTNKNKVF